MCLWLFNKLQNSVALKVMHLSTRTAAQINTSKAIIQPDTYTLACPNALTFPGPSTDTICVVSATGLHLCVAFCCIHTYRVFANEHSLNE